MIRLAALSTAGAVLGALAGAVALILLYAYSPALAIEMAHDRPGLLRGFYNGERAGNLTFAWTSDRGDLTLAGIDRDVDWIVDARIRGARADPALLPDVTLLADGVPLLSQRTSNDFQNVRAVIPARTEKRRGLTLSIAASRTFVPGPADPRALGVQVDRIALTPGHRGVFPPRRAVAAAAVASGVFGATFGALAATTGLAVASAILLGVAQAAVIRVGLGPFARWLTAIDWLAAGIGVALLGTVLVIERWRGEPLRHTARFALMFTASALYLKLLVLLHPDKFLVDALFHAHRLQLVMAGTYVFTSIAPGGYTFPYPVGLYVAALPFTHVLSDHVLLLRLVAAGTEAIAAGFLYWMLARSTGERLVAAVAVAVLQLMPLQFSVLASANLTQVFAQAIALIAMSLIAVALTESSPWRIALACVAVVVAFLSHTSTFATLSGMLAVVGALTWEFTDTPATRRQALRLLAMLVIAIVTAIALYYGRFGPTYRVEFARIRAEVSGAPEAGRPASAALYQPGGRSILSRAMAVPGLVGNFFTCPFAALAVVGLALGIRSRRRDACWLTICGWLVACGGFLVLGILTPLDFRHYYASLPAIAVLTAIAAVQWWQAGGRRRVVTAVLTLGGAVIGANHWLGMIGAHIF